MRDLFASYQAARADSSKCFRSIDERSGGSGGNAFGFEPDDPGFIPSLCHFELSPSSSTDSNHDVNEEYKYKGENMDRSKNDIGYTMQ